MRRAFLYCLTAVMTLFRPVFPAWNAAYTDLPVTFQVDCVADVYAPDSQTGSGVCEYPAIVQLCCQQNAQDNGKLLVTFEKWGDTYPVYESVDDAQSWQYVGSVSDQLNAGYRNEWMPFLYELPADIGQFSRGTILLAATSVYGEGVTDSTITLYESRDSGRTFTAFCNVDKAGGTDWGVWEPYLIYDEQSGRLFCFYSDDSDPSHSQKLVFRYTTDLVHWSEKTECVACSDPDLRPGMPSVVRMGNGTFFLVFEMVGIDGNPICCKTSGSLDDWGDAADWGQVVCAAGKTFGSSPCAAWSPTGGRCGTLIVAGKHPVKGASKTGCDLFLSFDYGKTFVPVDNPIPYVLDPTERCGYSPSLLFSHDGETLYYVNNPPVFSSAYKITAAKITIRERKEASSCRDLLRSTWKRRTGQTTA